MATATRATLSDAVYREVGLSRDESAQLVDAVLEIVAQTLERGETVKLSSFGIFSVRGKTERVGRNPRTGVEAPITARRVVVFRASRKMKERIDGAPRPGPRGS